MCFSLLAEVFLLLFSSVPSSQRWNGVKLSPRCVLFPTQKHLRSEVFAEVLGFFLCQIRYCSFNREYIIRLGSFLWSFFAWHCFSKKGLKVRTFFRSHDEMIETSFFQKVFTSSGFYSQFHSSLVDSVNLNVLFPASMYCFRLQGEVKIPPQQSM